MTLPLILFWGVLLPSSFDVQLNTKIGQLSAMSPMLEHSYLSCFTLIVLLDALSNQQAWYSSWTTAAARFENTTPSVSTSDTGRLCMKKKPRTIASRESHSHRQTEHPTTQHLSAQRSAFVLFQGNMDRSRTARTGLDSTLDSTTLVCLRSWEIHQYLLSFRDPRDRYSTRPVHGVEKNILNCANNVRGSRDLARDHSGGVGAQCSQGC